MESQSKNYVVKYGDVNIQNIVYDDFILANDKKHVVSKVWYQDSECSQPHTFYIQTHNLSQWTITYYAQMPDGLKNNDGKLFVKDKNDNEFSILPKEGECILFPSHVLHKPETNQTSTKSRIVFASHFTIFNENSFSIKTNKSIL